MKLKTVSQKYFKNIQTKAIVLRVSYAFKRAYRDAFCSIKSYADYKCSSELYLIAVACNYKSLSKILYKFSFQKIKNLPKIIKFSKILTRTLKPRLLDSFDSVINFGAKFDLLVNVLSRLHLKALDLAFFRLKIKLNKSNTRYKLFETPDSSIFQESDMVLMQSVESFGDLTTTAGTTQKIKKYYSSEHSLLSMTDLKPKKLEMCQTPPLEILQTPRGTRHISSGIQTSLHFDKEPLSYQQRLIKNIMSKAGYPIENSKTTELKFIKPP